MSPNHPDVLPSKSSSAWPEGALNAPFGSIVSLAVVLLAFWGAVVYQLSAQWSVYEQYAYGWAVPFLSLYLLWSNRKNILQEQSGARSRAFAMAVVAFGCLLFFPTWVVVEANPIWRAASYAIVVETILITVGVGYLVGGKSWARWLAFPACFVLAAVPWPSAMEATVIEFLTRINTSATIEILSLLGVPALQHGNLIEISVGVVGVDEACSGVRSVQATFMMTLFFGALYRFARRARFGLIALGLLLAFICNVARTSFLAWVASRDGMQAIGRWHDSAGVAILVACFTGVWITAEILRKRQGRKTGEQAPPPAAEGHLIPFVDLNSRLPVFLTVFLGSWLALTVVATEFWFQIHESRGDVDWRVEWPQREPQFREVPIPDSARDQLKYDEGHSYAWRDAAGRRWQSFYFQWHPAHTLKRRAGVHLAKTHRPERCLTATGKILERQTGTKVLNLGPLQLPYRSLVFNDGGHKLHVFFLAWEDGTPQNAYANMRSDTVSRLAAAWSGSRGKGQRVMEVGIWDSVDSGAAESAFQDFMQNAVKARR